MYREIGKQRKMRTSNGVNNTRSNTLGWYLLAECALGEMMSASGNVYESTRDTLFQLFQELGMPLEFIRKIELTLTGFAQQDRLERPGWVRVFCQENMIDDAIAAKTSRLDHAEPAMESVSGKDPAGTILNRGWGYFIIDRSGDDAGSSEKSSPLVDLYFYQEGE